MADGSFGDDSTMQGVVARDGKCVVELVEMPKLETGDVLIRTGATAINRADTLQRMGRYNPPVGATEVLGLELAGEIVQNNRSSVWRVGDRVMCLVSGGGNADYAKCHESHCIAIPEGVSMEEAAGIPETFLTAFQLLRFLGEVQPGQKVVIHAAGSGVGTSAIQLAREMGVTDIIAVAGSEEKLEGARRLGAALTVNYKAEKEWSKTILEKYPDGVDVILDCVGGSFAEENSKILKTDAIWVLYGLLGGADVPSKFLATILRKRVQLRGTTLRARSDEYKTDLVQQFSAFALDRFKDKRLAPVIFKVFEGLESVQEAHELMESGANVGKIVIKV